MSAANLTTEELAAELDVEPRTVEDYRLNGTGPRFFRLGNGGPRCPVRYRRADVDEWIRSRLSAPVP